MTTLRPVDPVSLTLAGGQERKFLLTLGGIRRLKSRFGIKNIREIFDRDVEECGVPFLYESLLDKDGITEDAFAEVLPCNPEWIAKAIAMIFGATFPEQMEANPPQASPAATDGTGSSSAPSGSDA